MVGPRRQMTVESGDQSDGAARHDAEFKAFHMAIIVMQKGPGIASDLVG